MNKSRSGIPKTGRSRFGWYKLVGHKPVPCDKYEGLALLESTDRSVCQTDLPNGMHVSTVFLPLDHQFGDGPPLVFETMVFDRDGTDRDTNRYSTWDEAEAGHLKMVEEWKDKNG